LASRIIKTEEVAQLAGLGDMTSPACEHILGLDGIAVIVSRKNPVEALAKDQIAQIFKGEIRNWQQVGGPDAAIHLYARDDKSGTYDTFTTLVLGNAALTAMAKRIEDSRKLSDSVAQDPNGIGFIGLPYIQETRAIAVYENGAAAFMPTPFTVATEDYVLSRRLFLYTAAHPRRELTGRFVDFALSSMGQNIVAEVGFVGQNVSAAAAAAGSTAMPADYRRLTSGSDRLSLDFVSVRAVQNSTTKPWLISLVSLRSLQTCTIAATTWYSSVLTIARRSRRICRKLAPLPWRSNLSSGV
jgi:phosphate transport system substrate-binding protein